MYTLNNNVIECTYSTDELFKVHFQYKNELLKVYFQCFIYLMLLSTVSLVECSLKYYNQKT